MYLLIDESGRIYDPIDNYLVFVGVYSSTLVGLEKIVSDARNRIPQTGKRRKEKYFEIKFSNTGDKTRAYVLEKISYKDVSYYVLIIEKEGRKIPDTPATYCVLLSNLIRLVQEKSLEHIIIDKHFTNKNQIEEFNEALLKATKRDLFIEHIDSNDNPVVAFPDFIAGAIRLFITKKEQRFYNLIKQKIAKVEQTTWKQIKKR